MTIHWKRFTNARAPLIILFSILLYANTLNHGFVFDDSAVLSSNAYVQEGLGGLGKIFTEGSWQGFDPESDMHIYRPMQLAVLATQYEFFGLNPFGYHLVHVLTYALLCFLVFQLLQNLFAQYTYGPALALLTTIIFTAHPVHTEVVANIKGNGDLLAMLFGILSLHCLHRYSTPKVQSEARLKLVYLTLSAFCFLLALLTKETIVSFFGVAILVLYFFSDLSYRKIIFSTLPLLAMVAFYLGLRGLVFGEDSNRLTDTSEFSNVLLLAETSSQKLGTLLYALGKNLQLVTVPYPLVVMYAYNSVPIVELWDIRAVLSFVAYLLLGVSLLFHLKRGSIWGFAIAFYLTTLALFSNTVFSIPNLVSERWLLIPSLGACLCIAYALLSFYRINPRVTIGVTLLILIGYSGYTIERNRAWESNLTLGQSDVETAPRSVIINRMYARSLLDAAHKDGMNSEKLGRVADAYKRILREAPNDASVYLKLANIYEQMAERRLAVETYEKAASYRSDVREAAQKGYLRNLIATEQYTRAAHFFRSSELAAKRDIATLSDAVIVFAASNAKEEALARLHDLVDVFKNSPADDLQSVSEKLNALGIQLENRKAHAIAAVAFKYAAENPSPIQGRARFSAAKNLNLAGQYTTATKLWRALEDDYPTVVDVIAKNIVAQAASGEMAAANKDLQRYITRILQQDVSRAPILLNNLGIDLENSGIHVLAATVFSAAAATDSPIKGRARFAEAKNLNLGQLYADALPAWQSLLADYPELIDVKIGLAEALQATGNEAEARQAYREVLQDIKVKQTYWQQATNRRKAENSLRTLNAKAEAFFESQMALIKEKQVRQPDSMIDNDLNQLAITLEDRGAHRLAAQTFEKLARLDSPLKGKALYAEANNLNLAGDYSAAVPKWRSLNQTYPNVVDVLMGSAEAHEKTGDLLTAKAHYKRALVLITPENMSERFAAHQALAEQKISSL